ncbi:MAG: substrate-binding domain-containing protein [Acetivibrio sp.]
MNNKASYIMIVIMVIFLFFGIGIYGYLSDGKKQESYHVSVIMESNNAEYWSVLKQGIESGAKECKIKVNFVTVSSKDSTSECLNAIQREIQNGADGLILNLDNRSHLVKKLDEVIMNTQIVLVESEIPLSKEYSYITPDNFRMGEDLGKIISLKCKNGKKAGIIVGNKKKTSDVERKNGILKAMSEKNVRWILEMEDEVTVEQLKEKYKAQPVDYLVGVNNIVTEKLVDAFKEELEHPKIYGIGNTEKIVYYMDKGLVDTIVTPNEYVMGYTSIKTMYTRLDYGSANKKKDIDYLVVNQKNLYNSENQIFMFPMIQ